MIDQADIMRQKLLIVAGSLFVALGFVGIFLPLLPTTPFLLLAAGCYARSSERFYDWLINNKYMGGYIRNYREGKGVPARVKVVTLLLLWITIGTTVIFGLIGLISRIVLVIIATAVTVHIACIRTADMRSENARSVRGEDRGKTSGESEI